MSMTTPAGWYPDPSVPSTERWWDGTAWTAHTRPVQAHAPAVGSGPQTAPLQQSTMPANTGGGGGKGRVVALVTAGAVLVAAVVTGAVLLGKGDESAQPDSTPTASAPAPTTADPKNSPATTPSADDSALLIDQLNGISMPVPAGWEKSESSLDEGTTMVTDETYDCPGGGSSLCRHGRVSSITAAQAGASSVEALARRDVVTAADAAYDEDAVGTRVHGGITSHTVLKSQPIAVAGRAGYLVRWRVITGAGPGGYVQSLAFPSTVGTEALVVVRFAFDAGPEGPKLADMDKIAESIRPTGDSTGGGVGSSIGPGHG
ncbi:DUF2510 domain-containing protein [Streptomyces lunaelactis]|uniref:DUF2510 domain-containing protein n=1 Tax=Streptomyces lunaelactis TaxID=1535768 RepID=UPI001585C6EC|nr:DUF2510 domain-containing protein [Streptomyces lunaelactis]NUK12243.1 DUF2510 domain-containing protein [Streptomyces lunaelactis]NUL14235.1 DUF2510 domain-containing protein [Streptomyces lunaelactis]NUL27047.1 DUF2510 domain-containing protein [Streptomyces lunaelactis]